MYSFDATAAATELRLYLRANGFDDVPEPLAYDPPLVLPPQFWPARQRLRGHQHRAPGVRLRSWLVEGRGR